MGAVAQEKERGTAAMMLVKPFSRRTFLGAKFAASGLTFAASIALSGAAGYLYTLLLFEALDVGRWLGLNLLILVNVLVYVALTLLCSVLTRSQAAAGGLAFGLLIVPGFIGALPTVGTVLPGQPVAWGGWLMSGEELTVWPALAVSAGIIVAALVGAWLAFERQEI